MTTIENNERAHPLAALAQIILLQSRERLPMPDRVSAGTHNHNSRATAHIDLADLSEMAAWRAALLNVAGDCHDFTDSRNGHTTHCHRFSDLFGIDVLVTAKVPDLPPGPQLDPTLVDKLAAAVSGSDGAA